MEESRKIAWKKLSVEAAAIVISILLAFGIEAWWQDRNEVKLERRLLSALLVEFEQNSELLNQARMYYEERYTAALRVLEYLDDGTASQNQAEFEESIRGLLVAGTMHLESGAHDGLLASGELSLIQDEELRNRLAAWPSYVREWSEEQDMVFAFVREELVPYISDAVRIRSIADPFLPFPDGQAPPLGPAAAKDASSLLDVSASIRFDNLVHKRAQGLWYAMRDGETLLARTNEISELIMQNIEK